VVSEVLFYVYLHKIKALSLSLLTLPTIEFENIQLMWARRFADQVLRSDIGRLFAVCSHQWRAAKDHRRGCPRFTETYGCQCGAIALFSTRFRVLHVGTGKREIIMCWCLPISRACFYCGV
jgi:hypothetical protein